jgi:2-alkyl-3-oxoalkanoate reductase
MQAQSIFVTGATGVIGRRVVPELVRRGHRVTAVGRSPEKRAALERMGATAVALDMYDIAAATRALAAHDTVINLATHIPASSFKMLFRRSWRENDRVRREGSAALVSAALAAGVTRFIQESFAPTYEDGGAAWIDEQWRVRPVAYNQSVLDAERSAERFSSGGGTGVVLRFAAFYGPDPLLRAMVDVVRKGWCPLPGKPDAYISSIAHEDAASATIAAIDLPGGIYNVCDDEPLTRRAWANALASAAGAKPPKLMPAWIGRMTSLLELLSRSERMSNQKLRAASGWAPRWRSAAVGLPAAVAEL